MSDVDGLRAIFARIAAQHDEDEQQLFHEITNQWDKHGRIVETETLRLIGYSSQEFYQACLDCHSAKKLSYDIENVDRAFEILTVSYHALVDVVGKLHARLTHENLSDVDLNLAASEATRELYTYSCAALSLVQAYRHLFPTTSTRVAEYESAKILLLTNVGIIKFVSDLRRSNNHLHVQVAHPHYTIKFGSQREVASGITFDTKYILTNHDWSEESKELVRTRPKLQIVDVVKEHYAMAENFRKHILFMTGINGDVAYRDLRKIKKAREIVAQIVSLGLFLHNATARKVDPYPYLAGRFTHRELENIFALPDHSAEQVDYMISLYDTIGLCDRDTRKSLYKLFGVKL